jgi:DNA-binding response OmpR family regulator
MPICEHCASQNVRWFTPTRYRNRAAVQPRAAGHCAEQGRTRRLRSSNVQPSVVLVASARGSTADEIAGRLKREGAVVLTAHSAAGCLRVATSVGPDVIMLDGGLPRQLEKLLRAHPVSARARVIHLSEQTTDVRNRKPLSLSRVMARPI